MQQISVTVEGPEGLPKPAAITLRYAPANADEFEAIVHACGGPGVFTSLGEFAFADLGSCGSCSVHLFEPGDAPKPLPIRQAHPFMAAFEDRIRDAKRVPVPVEEAA